MEIGKEVTIYDVARVLNLSPSTVSRGLNDNPRLKPDTIDRIKNLASEMGYRHNKFASNLRLKRTNTLGLVVPKLDSYFMATVISGIEKVTNENGYGLIISTSQEREELEASCIETLYGSRVDGIMVSLASNTERMNHFSLLSEKKTPLIFFDRVGDFPGCINVVIDNAKAGFEVTTHLLEQGCKRIMHVGGYLQRNVYSDRYSGYRQALIMNGIEITRDLVMTGDLTEGAGTEAARKIVRMKHKPDAVFVANDIAAVGLILELKRNGIRVPEDICVAGFNNEPVSHIIQPNLTTVNYPAREIGEITASVLINILKGNNPSENNIYVAHELILRESSIRLNL